MKARAPGKVVLSGAYAVLEGAPALVAAVDRYVEADSSLAATRRTAEVGKAIELGLLEGATWFDARALRSSADEAGGGRKLGLGSSAAILVATLAVADLQRGGAPAALADRVFPLALTAHRAAQPGGSGVDVAASCFGGVVCCSLAPETGALHVAPHALPSGLVLRIFSCPGEASTQHMLQAVGALRAAERASYDSLMRAAREAAEGVNHAATALPWIAALAEQFRALATLGSAAQVPIVTAEVAELGELARSEAACFGPSGAGGGDVALFAGPAEPSVRWLRRASALGLSALSLDIGVAGVHRVP